MRKLPHLFHPLHAGATVHWTNHKSIGDARSQPPSTRDFKDNAVMIDSVESGLNGTFDTQISNQANRKKKIKKTVYEHLLYCKQVDNEALLCDGAKGRKK